MSSRTIDASEPPAASAARSRLRQIWRVCPPGSPGATMSPASPRASSPATKKWRAPAGVAIRLENAAPGRLNPATGMICFKPICRSSSVLCGVDPQCLDLAVLLELLQAGLAPVAAHLVAAERHRGVHELIAIDPHRT